MQMSNGYMKTCPTSLFIMEMQIKKTTMTYLLTPVRMTIVKKAREKKMLVRVWRKETPCALLVAI